VTRGYRLLGALVAAAAVVGLAAPAAATGVTHRATPSRGTPSTSTATPIKHFVSVMQEMRSFDSYFGLDPRADGIPPGVCLPAPAATGSPCVAPYAIGNDRSRRMLDTHAAFEAQYANGAMNGFVAAQSTRGVTNPLPMAHYTPRQLPYYTSLAHNYVLFDRYFSSASGGSLWNHLFWVAGSPGDASRETVPDGGYADLTTIFDRLQAKGVSWKFYVQDYDRAANFRAPGATPTQVARVPLLAFARFLDDPELSRHIVPLDRYYEDLGRNRLPAVSYIVAAGSSEAPPASVTNGEAFVRNLVAALKRSSAWSSSALMLSYADWGGWYDHVPPPEIAGSRLGFRVPALLVSPYARKGYVDHTQLEHASILKFIETNWGVPPLTARDAGASDLVGALDFRNAPRAPQLAIESGTPAPVDVGEVAVIYPAYGAAALLGVAAIAVALAVGRRRRRLALTR